MRTPIHHYPSTSYLPGYLSLKNLRLKWKSAKNRVSSSHGMILDSHDLMNGTDRDRQVQFWVRFTVNYNFFLIVVFYN